MTDQRNLEVLLRSHFPLLLIETGEEPRALDLLRKVCGLDGRRMLVWTATEGLRDHAVPGKPALSAEGWRVAGAGDANPTGDPEEMLELVRRETRQSVVVLVDFHPYLGNPRIVRFLKELALNREVSGNTLVLISPSLDVPAELRGLCSHFELTLPDETTLRQLVLDEAKVWGMRNQAKLKADRTALELLIQNLRGLTLSDATRLVRNAIYKDNAITHSDVADIQQAKYRLVGQEGVLSFEHNTAGFAEVGGLRRLKAWLERRKKHFLAGATANIDVPRGVMLLGVQGCGKSLAARCVAGVWGVPLLRLDFAALYNKYQGETEKNIRQVLKSAEVLAPCVLWVDEIEKGLAGGGSDTGTSQRVLGTLLTWMSETRARSFIVATANDVQALPPELLRKGRLDEVFFVDLPDAAARAEILAVHLRKRALDPAGFDLTALAAASEGFSGAELEQAVVSARYASDGDAARITTQAVLAELRRTRPLSVLMAEQIAALRLWARDRTVAAD